MRPFGCPVTILNTLHHLGKFDGTADEGFLVGYSVNSKAFRVFNSKTRKVKENMHVSFLENKPNVAGSGPESLFDNDSLTKSMNYEPVSVGNQSNGDACIQTDIHAEQVSQEKAAVHEYILLLLISSNPSLSLTIQSSDVNAGDQPRDVNAGDIQGDVDEISRNDDVCQGNEIRINSSTHAVNAASTSISNVSNIIVAGSLNINTTDSNHTNMPTLEAIGIFDGAFNDRDLGAEADTNNLDSSIVVSHIPTIRVHKDHPRELIIGDPNLNTQTRRMKNFLRKLLWSASLTSREGQIIKIFKTACLFVSCPKWNPRRMYGLWWIYLMEKELLAQNDFIVYQMDMKSLLLYGKIEEEVYVCQPPRFEDLNFPNKVYKVKKALYGLHQASRALISWQCKKKTVVANFTTEAEYVAALS
nr:retrovirus-related Pol polyprotein from transposon TNT 1-94 [Tanacetum cinerariifolium]